MHSRKFLFLLSFLSLLSLSSSLWFLGVTRNDYSEGETVPFKVGKLSSIKTFIPYPYYSLAFCQRGEMKQYEATLGEFLLGDRYFSSAIKIEALKGTACRSICRSGLDGQQLGQFITKIGEGYKASWLLDDLPAVNGSKEDYVGESVGLDIGYQTGDEETHLYNHFDIVVEYSRTDSKINIVGFYVLPLSIKYDWDSPVNDDDAAPEQCVKRQNVEPLKIYSTSANQTVITWTYSLTWKESSTQWSSRWSAYFQRGDSKIHWFSVINSLLIAIFMTAMVAMILVKTLRNDLRKYAESQNFVIDDEQPTSMDAQEMAKEEVDETGWKQIHGDVFRAPSRYALLCILVGSGAQTFVCALITIVFAAIGFLSPVVRGALLTALIVVYPVMGIFSGYTSARLYKMFGGTSTKTNWLLTIFFFPGIIFSLFFVTNWVLWAVHSSAGVDGGIFVGVFFLWFGVTFVMSSLGSWFGFRRQPIEHPVKINPIPRQIPTQPWYAKGWLMVLIGGILPFGVIFVESYFLFSSLWLQQFYYLFGFLLIIFLIFLITCAETSIVMCYLQLSREDYHWWWRSFWTTSSSTLYIFLYAFFYFFLRLSIKSFAAGVLYYLYTLIICSFFLSLTGFLGFYSCFFFVRKIYGSIKID